MRKPDFENPDLDIAVGDRVISYDFPDHYRFNMTDRGECYIEGTVHAIEPRAEAGGCDCYVVFADRRVWDGKEEVISPAYVYPPVNGTPQMFSPVNTFGVVKA